MRPDAPYPHEQPLTTPAHLSPRSQELWRELAGVDVKGRGPLTLLQTALEALDRADQARVNLDRDGLTFTTEATGALHVNPLARVEKDNRAQFITAWKTLTLHCGPAPEWASGLFGDELHDGSDAAADEQVSR